MTSQFKLPEELRSTEGINHWAKCYTDEQTIVEQLVEQYLIGLKDTVLTRNSHGGYLLYNEFYDLYCWKLKRQPKDSESSCIEKITGDAFCLDNDCEKLEKLTKIHNVGKSVASAILHFYDRGKYPILDQHALRSVGICEKYVYGPEYPFWQEYVDFCQSKAKCYNVSMRNLDRALWKYSESGTAAHSR